MTEIPTNTPEKQVALDDNDLKFTLSDLPFGVLYENAEERKVRSYLLTTDWLETGETNEKKIVRKKHEDGTIEMLLIEKQTDATGNRPEPPKKEILNEEQYNQLLLQSVLRVEKVRSEFKYQQNGTTFSMKYDDFVGSKLRVLEVNAGSEAERLSFDRNEFLPGQLTNVTGQIEYYGYRVAKLVS